MVLQIISAKKTILAKLLHLLTGFISEIRNFDHKFTTFTTNLALLYNTRQNDLCPGKPVKQALLGYTRQDKNRLPLSRGER